MPLYVLALEASTQAAKAAVVGRDGRRVSAHSAPYPPDVSDIATLDAPRVYEVLLKAGRAAVEEAQRAGVSQIAAAGLCTIWQSLLPLDRQGEPMARAQTWAHTAAGETATRVRMDAQGCAAYYRATGCIPHSQLPVFQAMHIRQSEPGLWRSAAKWGSLNSYLLGRLTGRMFEPRCTMAGSGFLNLHEREWDPLALQYAGLEPERLSPLCDALTPLPLTAQAAEALGVGPIAIAAGGGDGGLNQIGSGALRPGVMTCSIGTSSALRIASRTPVLSDPPSTWCYYADQGWYVAGAATSGACNCVDWVRQSLLGGAPFGELEQALSASRDRWADAPIFLPFLWGERCPGWDDGRAGGFAGLRGGHGTGEIYYAALEGVIMLLRMCYERIVMQSGEPEYISLSGGITNSRPWMRMAADVFGRPVEISPAQNASLMGAAALALNAAGGLENLCDFPVERGEILLPDAAMRTHYRARYARFLEEYDR